MVVTRIHHTHAHTTPPSSTAPPFTHRTAIPHTVAHNTTPETPHRTTQGQDAVDEYSDDDSDEDVARRAQERDASETKKRTEERARGERSELMGTYV